MCFLESTHCAPWQVYAVETSDIADQAEAVINHNGFSSKIEVIKEKLEEVDLPEKMDVIISEWMGTMLLVKLDNNQLITIFSNPRWPGNVQHMSDYIVCQYITQQTQDVESMLV